MMKHTQKNSLPSTTPFMEPTKTRLEKIAESQNLVFFSLFIILIPLMMHTAHLLLSVSIIKDTWYAYFFAIGFDLAIFIFAAHGRLAAAGGIAFIVFLLNASVLNLDTLYTRFDPLIVKLIITTILAGTSAWILHSYVMMFNERKTETSKIMDLHQSNHQKEIEINKLKKELENKISIIHEMENKIKELQIDNEVNKQINKIEKHSTSNGFVSETYIQLEDRIICKLCNNSFENKEKYNHYKNKYCSVPACKESVKTENKNEPKKTISL